MHDLDFKPRHLQFEDCEKRLLLTTACSIDVAEPTAEFATENDTDSSADAKLSQDSPERTDETVDDSSARELGESTKERTDSVDAVNQLISEPGGDPTADDGPT